MTRKQLARRGLLYSQQRHKKTLKKSNKPTPNQITERLQTRMNRVTRIITQMKQKQQFPKSMQDLDFRILHRRFLEAQKYIDFAENEGVIDVETACRRSYRLSTLRMRVLIWMGLYVPNAQDALDVTGKLKSRKDRQKLGLLMEQSFEEQLAQREAARILPKNGANYDNEDLNSEFHDNNIDFGQNSSFYDDRGNDINFNSQIEKTPYGNSFQTQSSQTNENFLVLNQNQLNKHTINSGNLLTPPKNTDNANINNNSSQQKNDDAKFDHEVSSSDMQKWGINPNEFLSLKSQKLYSRWDLDDDDDDDVEETATKRKIEEQNEKLRDQNTNQKDMSQSVNSIDQSIKQYILDGKGRGSIKLDEFRIIQSSKDNLFKSRREKETEQLQIYLQRTNPDVYGSVDRSQAPMPHGEGEGFQRPLSMIKGLYTEPKISQKQVRRERHKMEKLNKQLNTDVNGNNFYNESENLELQEMQAQTKNQEGLNETFLEGQKQQVLKNIQQEIRGTNFGQYDGTNQSKIENLEKQVKQNSNLQQIQMENKIQQNGRKLKGQQQLTVDNNYDQNQQLIGYNQLDRNNFQNKIQNTNQQVNANSDLHQMQNQEQNQKGQQKQQLQTDNFQFSNSFWSQQESSLFDQIQLNSKSIETKNTFLQLDPNEFQQILNQDENLFYQNIKKEQTNQQSNNDPQRNLQKFEEQIQAHQDSRSNLQNPSKNSPTKLNEQNQIEQNQKEQEQYPSAAKIQHIEKQKRMNKKIVFREDIETGENSENIKDQHYLQKFMQHCDGIDEFFIQKNVRGLNDKTKK